MPVKAAKEEAQQVLPVEKEVNLAPVLAEEFPVVMAPVFDVTDIKQQEPAIIHWELKPAVTEEENKQEEKILSKNTDTEVRTTTVDKMLMIEKSEGINSMHQEPAVPPLAIHDKQDQQELMKDSTSGTSPLSAAAGGYLARPSNIYAESKAEVFTSMPSAEEPVLPQNVASSEQEELLDLQMQLVERDDIPAADMPLAHQAHPDSHREPLSTEAEDPAMRDEAEEQKRRAAERLHKLRNLSFNVNAADPNNEFETVPAYIRRNMELHTGSSSVENFYSNYEVKTDHNNQAQISTINTFLDGKKPD
jgi:cell division protein FtsZ